MQAGLLAETFNVNDPVHGFIMLPLALKKFIDHRFFQRTRFIKQLGICSHIYPGATHTRFAHSIGTAFLSFEMMKTIRARQPELSISDKDVICVALAGLLHDLGHPCFSHMFEVFVKRVGKSKLDLTEEQRARYLKWNHEEASQSLTRLLWSELLDEVALLGLSNEDLEFICLLIDPPKKALHEAMAAGRLREAWSQLMPCIPVEKGWMFEIVSNWRSGLDTDRFDYFRRDSQGLGINKEFDHQRYIYSVRAIFDAHNGVWTLSPPDKDRDLLREDMLELRRSLHRKAYQHKTTQKIEQHMVDILELMENSGMFVVGKGGKHYSLSEAAIDFDATAYVQLTDGFVESRLYEHQGPDSPLHVAYEEYERRVIRRHLFRLLADFDVPPDLDFAKYAPEEIIMNMLQTYHSKHGAAKDAQASEDLNSGRFRCHVAEFHLGMKRDNPLEHVLFHSSKDPRACNFLKASEVLPCLTQKVFIFFDGGPDAHNSVLMRQLVDSFTTWASNVKPREDLSSPKSPPSVQASRVEHTPQGKRRKLDVKTSSIPDNIDELLDQCGKQ